MTRCGGSVRTSWPCAGREGASALSNPWTSPRCARDARVALDFLEAAVHAKDEQFKDLITASGDIARSKGEFDSNMDTIAVLLEDLLYISEGLSGRIVNIDLEARLRKLAQSLQTDQLARIGEFLRTIEVYSDTHVNRQMMTDVLAVSSNAAMSKIANDNPRKSR